MATVYLVHPLTLGAQDWVRKNVASEPWQWFGSALAVEHRFIEGLVAGMVGGGLELDVDFEVTT